MAVVLAELRVRDLVVTNSMGASGTVVLPNGNQAAEIGTFGAGATTPSVISGIVYQTNNGGLTTTISDFADGVPGQEITVIFKDNFTTIDFTSSSLYGNGGIDWAPSGNDHMQCVADGTNWWCSCFVNTSRA